MKKIVFVVLLMSVSLFSQEEKIPEGWDKILLEGKVAYMNLITGDVSTTLPKKPAKKPAPKPEFDPTILHKVSKGETLSTIARSYNITLAQLYRLNSMVDFDKIEIGDEVVIGYKEEEKEKTEILTYMEESSSKYHTVASGETLFRIAKTYQITVDELKKLNLLTTNSIVVGQQLLVK